MSSCHFTQPSPQHCELQNVNFHHAINTVKPSTLKDFHLYQHSLKVTEVSTVILVFYLLTLDYNVLSLKDKLVRLRQ